MTTMRQLEEYLTGGYKHGKWHCLWKTEEDGTRHREAVIFFMDAEYDAVRVTYDWEGGAVIHADGNKWTSLTADQLEWLAEKVREFQSDYLGVTSRKVIWLFSEQFRLDFVPVLHRLQGCFAAQG